MIERVALSAYDDRFEEDQSAAESCSKTTLSDLLYCVVLLALWKIARIAGGLFLRSGIDASALGPCIHQPNANALACRAVDVQ